MRHGETERLSAVRRFADFNFDLDTGLHGILKLATEIFETPAAFVTLMDEHDQWFKVNRGFDVWRMPRTTSFCTHTIRNTKAMVVCDTQTDARFANNPFVNNAPNIRFYAGAPLATHDGFSVGTLCVMDTRPKQVPEEKRELLEILARQVIHLMELQLAHKLLSAKMQQVDAQNKTLLDIAQIQSHEFRGPLATILGLMNVMKTENYQSPEKYLAMMEEAARQLDEKIHMVTDKTRLAGQPEEALRN